MNEKSPDSSKNQAKKTTKNGIKRGILKRVSPEESSDSKKKQSKTLEKTRPIKKALPKAKPARKQGKKASDLPSSLDKTPAHGDSLSQTALPHSFLEDSVMKEKTLSGENLSKNAPSKPAHPKRFERDAAEATHEDLNSPADDPTHTSDAKHKDLNNPDDPIHTSDATHKNLKNSADPLHPSDAPCKDRKKVDDPAHPDAPHASFEESALLKEKILEAMLVLVPDLGWTKDALLKAADQVGCNETLVFALFPEAEMDALVCWSRTLDLAMMAKLKDLNLEDMKVRERIFWGVRSRIAVIEPHKLVAKKAFWFLSHPVSAPKIPGLMYETVHLIWTLAGDTSTDYNFYTKRLLLSGVYSATFLYWLNDTSPEHHKTWKFLESRIENVLLIQKAKGLTSLFDMTKWSNLVRQPLWDHLKHWWPFP